MSAILGREGMTRSDNFDCEYAQIATDGYTALDLLNVMQRSMHEMTIRAHGDSDSTLTLQDFKKAQQGYTPVSLRNIQSQEGTKVSWEDIGGDYFLDLPFNSVRARRSQGNADSNARMACKICCHFCIMSFAPSIRVRYYVI